MDKLSEFNGKCITLLDTFKNKLQRSWNTKKTDKENIEKCFLVCNEYWELISALIVKHDFDNKQDEIFFFREIKPFFTCEIEFFSLTYQADMFIPDVKEQIPAFWKREELRLSAFTERYKSFYQYYKSGKKNMDARFFLRQNVLTGDFPVSKIYVEDNRNSTGYDHLLACIIAQERYNKYAKEKLEEIAISNN